MKTQKSATFIAWRFYLLQVVILVIVLGLFARLVDLTIFQQKFLKEQGNSRFLRIFTSPSFRGMIRDRNGYPLAISTTVYSIWLNPEEFIDSEKNLNSLSENLDIKKTALISLLKLYKAKNRTFMYLKRDVSPEVKEKIKALAIPGVYTEQNYKRFYPESEVTSHVIGFTNVDDQGQEGLELAYNEWLSGTSGKKKVIQDRLGRVIATLQDIQKQKPGKDLILSINNRLQYIAYRELLFGVKKNLAAAGSVIILDVKTGEILAMVNQPSFNPNNRFNSRESIRNRAVTDTFEPGSTIKAFSIACALNTGLYKPDTIINTFPGWINVAHHLVRDEHRKGPMSVTQILQYSSNVGVTKLILNTPSNQLWHLLHQVGFGENTGLGFPGERTGALVKRSKWPPFTLATLAFGYGLSVTPLQLAHAYAILANDGIKLPLSIIKIDQKPKGERVMDSRLANQMLLMLESTVAKGGTATAASIPGYHVAGKTGTARMLGVHGYDKHHHNASFVGIAPATHPRLVVAVVLFDPQGKEYMGGMVSAPIFKKIMENALRMLNIPPDDVASHTAN